MGKILIFLGFTVLMLRATALLPDEVIHTLKKQKLLETIQKEFPEYILEDISVIDDSLWFVVGEARKNEKAEYSGIFLLTVLTWQV